MIELSKIQNGTCKDAHVQELGALYNQLKTLMKNRCIICPCGNQLQEMGMTKGRENAKQFLFGFTNAELRHPEEIFTTQMQIGFQSFLNNETEIELVVTSAFQMGMYPEVPFTLHVSPQYSQEKTEELRRSKYRIKDILNDLKSQNGVSKIFEEQLQNELGAELQLFLDALSNPLESEAAFNRYVDEIGCFHRITQFSPTTDEKLHIKHLSSYCKFLASAYHNCLPYIWIRANLWTHLMQRSNRIVQGDNLDVKWAAAYLPFVDYAVTDHTFCELLYSSGLAKQYGAKVYSFRTLTELLDELGSINLSNAALSSQSV